MKIALLIDGSTITRWQAEALHQLGRDTEFTVYNCLNSTPSRRKLRHVPYYLLNLISLRSDRTRQVAIPQSIAMRGRVDFNCEPAGSWQKLPRALIGQIVDDRPDLIIKFGMGLLRVPDPEQLHIPILSYHHGDPRRYRGRPAGFYELLRGDRAIGQIVQVLSNQLDSGRVVAFAETKAYPHSYRKTMREAYAASPLLLPHAVRAVLASRALDIVPLGKAYRLPNALTVLRFVLQLGLAKAGRLAYGMFVEKAWGVAEAPRGDPSSIVPNPFPPPAVWHKVTRPRGYRFLADPFYHPNGDGILVEALSSSTGLGEILHISNSKMRRLLSGPGHFSYPATLPDGDANVMIPEISEWSAPTLYRLSDTVEEIGCLKLANASRLIDPTPYERDGTVYLFANLFSEGTGVLRLWTATRLSGQFEEHPSSPILISPAGARMGGPIIELGEELYRVGQDGRNQYGDGVVLFRIEQISPTGYRERAAGELRLESYRGPHTLGVRSDRMLFDFYRDRFSPFAGIRRLQGRLAGRA